ncbi:hypothetical protein B0H21DRAFT_744355 [Amylocystis lapponica]|nr:hypothetical protein B0H21DRAFT_744355 [Amylocystis lapponica]
MSAQIPPRPSLPTIPSARLAIPCSVSLPSLRPKFMTTSSPLASGARGSTPADLQSHLYTSFLQRKTADVALRIRGSWNAVYKLHRVILIQAGFFQSLFTSGFIESNAKLSSHHRGPDVIDIVFDDPNITRAAFEVCIARLYGGGPPLHISPALVPTPSQPLTPACSFTQTVPASALPDGHHPASPRFLLSLLATAVFLSMPSVATHALTAVLRTVGPHTAVRYLGFATGRGIGEPDADEPEAAVGLEGVAELELEMAAEDNDGQGTVRERRRDTAAGGDAEVKKEDPAEWESEWESGSDEPHGAGVGARGAPGCFYGAVSDKVGEAAACWLSRWGADILQWEEQMTGRMGTQEGALWSPTSIGRSRAGTVPSRFTDESFLVVGSMRIYEQKRGPPMVWRRGGLSARWVRGLLSSDSLFVRGEKERYDMAKTVVEMRRRAAKDAGLERDDEEEREWTELFSTGIYYANMAMDDLIVISQETSQVAGQPYVPIAVLQSAHWNQAVLRHHITARPTSGSSSPSTSPSVRDKELGIMTATADLSPSPDADTPYYPVPADASMRIGDSTGIDGASMDQLFDPASSDASAGKKSAPSSEANFFGLQQQRFPASACANAGIAKWTACPPFRFAVEFWDVDALKEKSRLHSHTVWYAGSLYNVYVQVVRKKGVQLGVYLHRQSSVDPIPPSSAPSLLVSGVHSPSTPAHGERPGHRSAASVSSPHTAPSYAAHSHNNSRSTTPVSAPNTPVLSSSLPTGLAHISTANVSTTGSLASTAVSHTLPATAPPVMPQQPYRDPRPAVSAYFAIACASATGASITRFTSAPDVFSVSQSWGWKSSSLRTEEYLEVGPNGQPVGGETGVLPGRREVSLRATVVLGVV